MCVGLLFRIVGDGRGEKPKKRSANQVSHKARKFPNRFEIEIIDNPQFGGHIEESGETYIADLKRRVE